MNASRIVLVLACVWFLLPAAAADRSAAALNLPYREFDQTPGSGWRAFSDKKQYREAAELIRAYLARHPELDRFERTALHWHAAQVLAIAGDTAAALKHIPSARHDPEVAKGPTRWNDYVAATETFLNNDRPTLLSIRERMAKEKPDDPNLPIVDSLVAHFGQPYAMAYKRK